MTTPEQAPRLGLSDFHYMLALGGRLFTTEADLPCKFTSPAEDKWFSPFRDRERAARRCKGCPFRGRCGYNAVASRATHGVWGGEVLPGDKPAELEPIYARLLAQFDDRRDAELGHTPAPPLPVQSPRRRQRRVA